jgi:hypothetical protein
VLVDKQATPSSAGSLGEFVVLRKVVEVESLDTGQDRQPAILVGGRQDFKLGHSSTFAGDR